MRNNSSNKLNVPQSKQGYNGDLGKAPMVRRMCPSRYKKSFTKDLPTQSLGL